MSTGLAIALVILAALMIWKRRAPRVVAWLLLFAGIGLSAFVLSFTGPLGFSLGGATITLGIVVGLAYLFYEEVIRKNKPHKFRTAIVAFSLGVLLVGLGGAVGSKVSSLFTGVAGRAGTVTNNLVNTNGR